MPLEHRDTRLRFEQWARNSNCEANTISAVHGIRMADVALAEGIPPTMGQSPFALARGTTFERRLFRDDAEIIREALVKAGVVAEGPNPFRDFRTRHNGGTIPNLDEALAATAALFRQIARTVDGRPRPELPTIVAAATVRIPGGVMLPEALLILDALAIRYEAKPTLIVGEIKTYPDRGGHTDGGELATARAQAGVYVHGLRLVLEELGLLDRFEVSTRGFLVLSRPGSNMPSIRANEDLRYQAKRAERGFRMLRAVAAQLPAVKRDPIAAVTRAATAYCENCVSFCDRAPLCHGRVLQAGDPVALGDDVARFLGTVDLPRAVALMGGAVPETPAERDLARRLGGTAAEMS